MGLSEKKKKVGKEKTLLSDQERLLCTLTDLKFLTLKRRKDKMFKVGRKSERVKFAEEYKRSRITKQNR